MVSVEARIRLPARLRLKSRSPLGLLPRQKAGLTVLTLFALLALGYSSTVGASPASVLRLLATLIREGDSDTIEALRDRIVILDIRLPRAILGFVTGAGLAVSGAIMQGLFRNPLADPGVVGVTSGASLGAVAYIVLSSGNISAFAYAMGIFGLPLCAFLGGLLVTILLYAIASTGGETRIGTLLIAGIAIAALAMASTGLLIYTAEDQQLRDITFWNLGSLAGSTWQKVGIAATVIIPCLLFVPFLARGLNAFTLGEAAAFHMGVPVQRFKNLSIFLVAAMTGVSVAFCGAIGFVGIIVPHILRLAVGPDHRFLLAGSALLGGTLLIAADMVARTIVAPSELPIGILTALIGAPFFLWILFRGRENRIM